MDTKQLVSMIKEYLLAPKQKQFPFQSFGKKLGVKETTSLIKYLLKYCDIQFDKLDEIKETISEREKEIKQKEIEQTENDVKILMDKLKKLKG
jgi:hypothetical protein